MTKREICETHEPIAYFGGLGGLEVRHIECGINDYLYLVAETWNSKKSYRSQLVSPFFYFPSNHPDGYN